MTGHCKNTPLKLLCIDDDPDFIEYFTLVSESFRVVIDSCGSIKEAAEKIDHITYDAFIVDLDLPDGSGFDLLEKIKEKNGLIAVITGAYRDEDSFRKLKEIYGVEYVLDKPIYFDRFENLLSNLLQREKTETKVSSKPTEKLEVIKQKYIESIPNKIEELSQLVKAVQYYPNQESLKDLKSGVHKIGGSAGSYGYPAVTSLCKELEYEIAHKLEAHAKVEKQWIDSLENFLNSIKYNFQVVPPIPEEPSCLNPLTKHHSVLYIIDPDVNFHSLIERKKKTSSLEIICESDPEEALSRLKLPEFNPKIILISLRFPGSNLTAFEIIEQVKKKPNFISTQFGILFEEENLDMRIEAAKNDVDYMFHKPISPETLLKSLSEILETKWLRGFKVLVLDDDLESCNFISAALNDIGIQVKTLQDPTKLYPVLEEYCPHLLLLDILLPQYDGTDLLKTLRADLIYRDLGVAIITHWKDSEVERKAFKNHADALYYKPLKKSNLQNKILNLGKYLVLSGRFFPERKMTGLPLYEDFVKKICASVLKEESAQTHLALIKINHFFDLILEIGRASVNKELIKISNLLLTKMNPTVSCFFIEPDRFAIFFEEHDTYTIEEIMRNFLFQAVSQAHKTLNLSCSIVRILPPLPSVHELLDAAEKGLREADIQEEPASIKIHLSDLTGKGKKNKILFVIDEDINLLKLITNAFAPYDISVKTFTTGEEALDTLSSLPEEEAPTLIITARKMPDMDGIEILEKIKIWFHHPIPLFFLTLYSSDEDIRKGLQKGALEYITKPFNLSILIQKVLKITYK